jgi:hypothetical protein
MIPYFFQLVSTFWTTVTDYIPSYVRILWLGLSIRGK